MARGGGTVVIKLLGDAAQLQKTLGDVEKTTRSFGDKLGSVGNKLTLGLTVPIVAGLGAATKAAAEDEAAQQKLALTLQNTVDATDEVVRKVEEQITAFQKVSTFTDDDLRPAFAALVSETRNVKEAQDLMTTAMDLAAARGIPLEQATQLLIKAHNGQTKGLAALGIETKNAEGKAAEFSSVMEDVNKVVGGQAAAALDTAAGKSAALKRDIGEMAEEIGAKFLPHVEKLVGVAADLVQKFSDLPEPVQNLGLGLVALAAVSGPIMTAASRFTALKNAVVATVTAADSLLLRLAPLAAGAGLIKEYVQSEEKGVGLGRGHTPVGIIKNLIESIPGLAGGGPVMAGRPYLVGERGPELFVPGGNGAIVPNGAGGVTQVNLVLDGRVLARALVDPLNSLQRRSGNLGLVSP